MSEREGKTDHMQNLADLANLYGPHAAVGADATAAPPYAMGAIPSYAPAPQPVGMVNPTPSPASSTASIALAGVVIVGIGAVAIWMYNKDEDRLAKMTPQERHQERMDRLAQGVAYSLVGKL
jgi:hypothetical protein